MTAFIIVDDDFDAHLVREGEMVFVFVWTTVSHDVSTVKVCEVEKIPEKAERVRERALGLM